jgi:prepilin-type N-terminal cleavage/methylation domain-containing protein
MLWPARMRDEDGFTLPELMVGMVVMSLLIVAIAGALIVSLKTTGSTEQRLHESQGVLITSSYLANDVESASDVTIPSATADCSSVFTTLATFTYSIPKSSPSPPPPATALYRCGTASNGETQVTRTFTARNGTSTTAILAHFAGTARPNVMTFYDTSQSPSQLVWVRMTFTKPSDCTLDCTYTLFGSRRSYNPAAVRSDPNPLPNDSVLLSTGLSSPLWVQGSCPDPGTTSGCIIDPAKTALPISDVQTSGWSPTPLWTLLSDADTATSITSAAGSKAEARVLLGSVNPPDASVMPTVEFHASSASNGAVKAAISIYDGNTLLVSNNIGNVNQPGVYDWTLSATDAAKIPMASYGHLTIGFSAPSAKSTDSLRVDGVAFDTLDLSAVGLLTIKGPLIVNSTLSSAVRLTGQKTATKISIINNGDFRIWSPGSCAGCNHNTVACGACSWVGQQPWTSYSTSIPDPLRSLPAPSVPSAGNCSGTPTVCTPGSYDGFSFTSDTQLKPGVYYLTNGMSITGSARLTCPTCTPQLGILLYIAGGSVTFAGSARVNLSAATPSSSGHPTPIPGDPTGLYNNILMFQARSDTSEVKIAGNSGSTTFCTMGGTAFGNCLNGVVYVPNSNLVTLATGSSSFAAKAVVAQNIKVSSSVTIG